MLSIRNSYRVIWVERILETIQAELPSWFNLIDISFLSDEMREKYRNLLQERMEILGFGASRKK